MHKCFLERIEQGVVLGDGAMGTQLYQRGVYINRNYDALNLTDPHYVKAVHRDYIEAGASLIETNTFGANAVKLEKFGFTDKILDINRAGALLAKRCADEGTRVCVAGSIGPLGKPVAPIGKISEVDAVEAFALQARGLIEGEVDVVLLETFIDLDEIRLAIRAVRSISDDIPVVAMMTIDPSGLTAYGRHPSQLARILDQEPIQLIGLNCSTGPQAILDGVSAMRNETDKPLAAFANAGEPKMVEGRILYLATPEYFAKYTRRMIQQGVRLVGGCCGTGPDHIRMMASAVRSLQPRERELEAQGVASIPVIETETIEEVPLAPPAERSQLGKLFAEKMFPVSCELHPPRTSATGRIVRQVRQLKAAGIDVINIPDGPRASARMSPMALAHIIQRETEMEAILHYTCRDRNILGMQSDLLGAEALEINNILAVTGDPPKLGDYPMATAVFDVDAIGLLKIANHLNHSRDIVGNPIKRGTSFYLGAGFNPAAMDLALEVDRLQQKIVEGAEYILTQPIFRQELLLEALEKAGRIGVPVMLGILPMVSYRNAEFYHYEVPGMEVPQEIRDRMKRASEKGAEVAQREGVAIAQEAIDSMKEHVQGVYIMPPFGRVEMAIDSVSILEGRSTSKKVKDQTEK